MAVADETIKGARILILEDDPLLAMDLEDFMLSIGAQVVGPVSSVEQALQAVDGGLPGQAGNGGIDGAVLDLNLRGTYSYPVIDRLRQAGIPFVVCSGYAELPETRKRLEGVALLPKPCDLNKLQVLLSGEIVKASIPAGSQAGRTG